MRAKTKAQIQAERDFFELLDKFKQVVAERDQALRLLAAAKDTLTDIYGTSGAWINQTEEQPQL